MTADLMFPILIILIMFILITEMESPIALMLIGFMFIPISFLFALSIGNYTHLFFSDISAFFSYAPFRWMFQGIMFVIPALSFFRLVYIKQGLDEAI